MCGLCVITVQSQGQYWWLGTQAFRGDSQQNTQQTSTKQLTLHNEEKNQKQVKQNQERLPLNDNKDIKQHPVENSPALQSLVEDDNQGIPFQDLPQTECPQGMQCVMEQFCDNEGFISSTRRELSKKDRKKRGELIVRQGNNDYIINYVYCSHALILTQLCLMFVVKYRKNSHYNHLQEYRRFLVIHSRYLCPL